MLLYYWYYLQTKSQIVYTIIIQSSVKYIMHAECIATILLSRQLLIKISQLHIIIIILLYTHQIIIILN